MGGGGIVQVASNIATAVAAPVVGTVKLAEAALPKVAEKVEKVPVIGTLAQGASSAGDIYGDLATAATGGGTAALKEDLGRVGKAGVIVGGAYGGSLVAGAAGVVGGVQIGSGIATKGFDIGSLTGQAAAYFGNTLSDNLGVDLNQFLPGPGEGAGGYDYSQPTQTYFRSPPKVGSVEPESNAVTWILGGAAVLVLLLALRRK